MEIDSTRMTYASAAVGFMTAADTIIQLTNEEGNASLIDEICEKGFGVAIEGEKQRKIQKLREELLKAMGFTEEDLEKMPPEQRLQVDALIAQEMKERMRVTS